MKRYEEDERCAKCGRFGIARFIAGGPHHAERLDIRCFCGFVWSRAPLDAKPEQRTGDCTS